jgi:hypothetical protein
MPAEKMGRNVPRDSLECGGTGTKPCRYVYKSVQVGGGGGIILYIIRN